ncbi:MAG: AzlC family ABC transporter permease [Ruminococcaceae bacterium]|nr:AzlC family ABC transporter permease [Oscillospiraceae bacterium]
MKNQFVRGLWHGVPIALGYLSVSFGFGIMAVRAGLSILAAVGISVTNLTSAGQAAGVGIIAAGGTILEMILTQLVINIRYSLMGISLSQKLDSSFTLPHKLLVSFGITDEIFAVSSSRREPLRPSYMYGLILISFLGWSSGTLLGAAAGQLLPESVTNAMGIVLYGMFIAIVVPVAREKRSVLVASSIAVLISVILFLLKDALPFLSDGFSVIISAVIAAAVASALFPIADEGSSANAESETIK